MANPLKGLKLNEIGITGLPNIIPTEREEVLGALIELAKKKTMQPGQCFQHGEQAFVIALSNGHRVIKVMAHLPPGMGLGEGGLKALYDVWITVGLTISRDRAQTILFAAVLEDDGPIEPNPLNLDLP